MEKEKFERAIAINNMVENLEGIKKMIDVCYKLTYVDEDNKGCSEWRMQPIRDLLDKHNAMIREEIQQKIDSLNAEIETL